MLNLNDETDENLLILFAQNKEKVALGVLFQRHMASAYHLAYKYMRNQADAEDAVQKAFINVMRYANDQNQPGMVKAWIMKTVINVCKNEITLLVKTRERHQKKEVLNNEAVPEQKLNQEELRTTLTLAIEQLPEHFRVPIWLNHYENMSIKEISLCLDKPEKTIRTQIARGLEKLQLALNGKGAVMNSVSIAALILEIKKYEKVPNTLIEKVISLASIKDSARIAVQVFQKKSIISNNILIFISVSAIVALGFLFVTSNINEKPADTITSINISKNNDKAKVSVPGNINLFYDFSQNEYPDWFSVKSGNPKLLKETIGKIENQFIQVDTADDFLINLNIPLQKKQFKLSYDIKAIGRSSNALDFHSLLSKIEQKGSVTFSFHSKFKTNEWNHIDIYMQNNVEAFYCNDKLLMVVVLQKPFESDLGIYFKNANLNIDNIKLISGAEITKVDFSKCVEIAKELSSKPGMNMESIPSPLPKIYEGQVKVYWGYEK